MKLQEYKILMVKLNQNVEELLETSSIEEKMMANLVILTTI
ncbi:hypothetical protein [Staphylococcus haemolyticus]|nr:hypothetical protein [Staphylococcus haemolyticus]